MNFIYIHWCTLNSSQKRLVQNVNWNWKSIENSKNYHNPWTPKADDNKFIIYAPYPGYVSSWISWNSPGVSPVCTPAWASRAPTLMYSTPLDQPWLPWLPWVLCLMPEGMTTAGPMDGPSSTTPHPWSKWRHTMGGPVCQVLKHFIVHWGRDMVWSNSCQSIWLSCVCLIYAPKLKICMEDVIMCRNMLGVKQAIFDQKYLNRASKTLPPI